VTHLVCRFAPVRGPHFVREIEAPRRDNVLLLSLRAARRLVGLQHMQSRRQIGIRCGDDSKAKALIRVVSCLSTTYFV